MVMKNTPLKETGREDLVWVWVPVEGEVMCARGWVWQMWAMLNSEDSNEKLFVADVWRGCSSWVSLRRCSVPVLWKLCAILFRSHSQVKAFCIRDQPWNWTQVQAAKREPAILLFGQGMFSHYESLFIYISIYIFLIINTFLKISFQHGYHEDYPSYSGSCVAECMNDETKQDILEILNGLDKKSRLSRVFILKTVVLYQQLREKEKSWLNFVFVVFTFFS